MCKNKSANIALQKYVYCVKSARLYFIDCCSAVLIYYTIATKCLRLFHSNNHGFVIEETGASSLNETNLKYFFCMLSNTFDFLCVTLAQTASLCLNFRGIEDILSALSFYEKRI